MGFASSPGSSASTESRRAVAAAFTSGKRASATVKLT